MKIDVTSVAGFTQIQAMYCDICDKNVVDSDIPDSGRFYTKSGHLLMCGPGTMTTTDYVSVVFAVCTECKKIR